MARLASRRSNIQSRAGQDRHAHGAGRLILKRRSFPRTPQPWTRTPERRQKPAPRPACSGIRRPRSRATSRQRCRTVQLRQAAGASARSLPCIRQIATIRAGVPLRSGCPETGSRKACTRRPMAPAELFSSDQWMGANIAPCAIPSVNSARPTRRSVGRFDPRQRAVLHARSRRVDRIDFDKRLGAVRRQARHEPRARHGMPLIADPPGIEDHGPFVRAPRPDVRHARQRQNSPCPKPWQSGNRKRRACCLLPSP